MPAGCIGLVCSCINNPALNNSYFFKIPVCLHLLHSHAGLQSPWLLCVAYLKGQVALLAVWGDVCGLCAPTTIHLCVFACHFIAYKKIHKSESLVFVVKTWEHRDFFFGSVFLACVCFCAIYLQVFILLQNNLGFQCENKHTPVMSRSWSVN